MTKSGRPGPQSLVPSGPLIPTMNPAKINFITILLDDINHSSLFISVHSVRHIHLKYIHKNVNRPDTRIHGARHPSSSIKTTRIWIWVTHYLLSMDHWNPRDTYLYVYFELYFFIQVAMESFCHVRYGNADCRKLDNYFVIIIKAELFYD